MSEPTAKQVMTDSVITLSPDASLLNALRLFVEDDIHGAPVVDDTGEVVGVITTSDVLRATDEERDTIAVESDYLRSLIEFSAPDGGPETADFQNRLASRSVGEVMEKGFISVQPDTPARQIARCLRENRIHRVWVVDGSRLVGVVSTIDLMSVIENGP